jgi:hypothetical protein
MISSGAYARFGFYSAIYTIMYTFVFTLEQLERCQDLKATDILRIIHIVLDQYSSYEQSIVYQDRYVTVVKCSAAQATFLSLI